MNNLLFRFLKAILVPFILTKIFHILGIVQPVINPDSWELAVLLKTPHV